VEQAILGTGSLDDATLAQFTRDRSFKTVVGDVKFGVGGGWSEARVLEVQYPQTVVWPASLASGALVYPYAEAKHSR
jgi:hypothetical protein